MKWVTEVEQTELILDLFAAVEVATRPPSVCVVPEDGSAVASIGVTGGSEVRPSVAFQRVVLREGKGQQALWLGLSRTAHAKQWQ